MLLSYQGMSGTIRRSSEKVYSILTSKMSRRLGICPKQSGLFTRHWQERTNQNFILSNSTSPSILCQECARAPCVMCACSERELRAHATRRKGPFAPLPCWLAGINTPVCPQSAILRMILGRGSAIRLSSNPSIIL